MELGDFKRLLVRRRINEGVILLIDNQPIAVLRWGGVDNGGGKLVIEAPEAIKILREEVYWGEEK